MSDIDQTTKPAKSFLGRIPPHLLWPGLVVALLGMQLTMCGVAIVMASGSGRPVVVQNYHQQALDWDTHQAALRHSADLNWEVVWTIEPEVDPLNRRRLRIDLIDSNRVPIEGAVATVLIFHHANAHHTNELTLEESTPGCYTAWLSNPRSGLWDLSLKVKTDEEQFVFNDKKTLKLIEVNQPRMLSR